MIHLRKWNAPGNILLWIFLAAICFALPWVAESFVKDGEYYTDTADVTIVDFELTPGMKISQTFTCRGSELTQINTFFDYVTDGTGSITGTVVDSEGVEVVVPFTYEMASYGLEYLVLPRIAEEPLEIGETYTLEWTYEDDGTGNCPTIRMYESKSPIERVSVDGKTYPMKLYLGYLYGEYYDVRMIVVTVLLLLLLMFFCMWEIEVPKKSWPIVREVLLVAVAVAGHFIFAVINDTATPYHPWVLLKNSVPIYIFVRAFFLVTNSLSWTGAVTGMLCFVAATVNYYVCEFRGTPIVPWDLAAAGTAATVAGSYGFECSTQLILGFLIMFFLIQACLIVVPTEKVKQSIAHKWRSSYALLVCIVLFRVVIYPEIGVNLWDIPDDYEKQGVLAAFIKGMRYVNYDEPKGYSEEKCQEILQAYDSGDSVNAEVATAENIIVIMNESFADLRVVADNDVVDSHMPYIDSMEENVIKADLYVPTIGGGTANTEFEVLAESSCAFTPQTPYQTLINRDIDSLVSAVEEQGYSTEVFHPYTRENWNRDAVYSYMGFDEYISEGEMHDKEPLRQRFFISDYSNYQQIIHDYENKEDDEFFLFNITIQNHGGYETKYDTFQDTVDLSEYGEFPLTETYLSLIEESDRQLQMLIEYFAKVEEPTLIVFFGDHQATIEPEFYELLYGKPLEELEKEEKIQQFITPLVIWANYDIDPLNIEIDKISANYLGSLIMKAANLPRTPYQMFMEEMYQTFPVFSGKGLYDSEGEFYSSYHKVEDDVKSDLLWEYRYLQYNRLKGK